MLILLMALMQDVSQRLVRYVNDKYYLPLPTCMTESLVLYQKHLRAFVLIVGMTIFLRDNDFTLTLCKFYVTATFA